jgi:transcriptional regulator with XRE-family HTH domain
VCVLHQTCANCNVVNWFQLWYLSSSKQSVGQAFEKFGLHPKTGFLCVSVLALAAHWTALVSGHNRLVFSMVKRSWWRQGSLVSVGIGAKLRSIRQQWRLSLREVEERSLRFAQERGNLAFRLSASWLNRLEREEHELSVSKLIVLADIYDLPTERLLRYVCPEDQRSVVGHLSGPNATMLLTGGRLDDQARNLLADMLGPDQPPDETGLLSVHDGLSSAPYRRGIIGKRDRTLDPMIPAGSIVQIDIQRRSVSSRMDWTYEFQRPIYFLMTREEYVCGWCELDKTSDWLTLVPHPLSPVPSRRWKYRTEIENIGRVVGVAIRLAEWT